MKFNAILFFAILQFLAIDSVVVQVPVAIVLNGNKSRINFEYSTEDDGLEADIASFCHDYILEKRPCDELSTLATRTYIDCKQLEMPTTDVFLTTQLPLAAEEMKDDDINLLLFQEFMKFRQTNRVCFVHISTYETAVDQLLFELLSKLEQSRLSFSLDAIWIFAYGPDIPSQDRILTKFSNISWIHRGTFSAGSEVQTLKHIYAFSKMVERLFVNDEIQILYLPGNALSDMKYKPIISYLVDKHSTTFHLLRSGAFDVVCSAFGSLPRRVAGNMWWATASHLCLLNNPNALKDSTRVSEWVLSRPSVRIHTLSRQSDLVEKLTQCISLNLV